MIGLIITVFVVGYLLITLEHTININKAATAILTGVLCWTIYIVGNTGIDSAHHINEELLEHLGEMSGILFFLMGAMTIVELIDAHDGFEVITKKITTTKKSRLLWILCFLSFFLSAALDNLTTTIVMVSLVRKMIDERKDRLIFIGAIVIAANAGGAWSPIGDVTTTMLWIGGQVSAGNIILKLILPSLVCLLVPLLLMSTFVKGNIVRPEVNKASYKGKHPTTDNERNVVFWLGLSALIFVPVFKTITHLPPFMGMMFGLGVLWVVTELIHSSKDDEDRNPYTVVTALRKIDVPSIIFFLGILLSIAVLQSTGKLAELALLMDEKIGDINIIVMITGVLSAIVDNVPLVAAAMGMYDLSVYPMDNYLWEFLAYCAGTGGSILIIGSAAGVAAMGLERIDFMWYLKKMSWLAFAGYIAGAFTYILQEMIFH